MRRQLSAYLIAFAAAFGLSTAAYAQDNDLDDLEMDVLVLPDEASDEGKEASQFGLDTANDARERGAEFGRDKADAARDGRGDFGSDTAGQATPTPPAQ